MNNFLASDYYFENQDKIYMEISNTRNLLLILCKNMDFQILFAFHWIMQGITKVVTMRLSNPDPAEAKLTPMIKSCFCRFG